MCMCVCIRVWMMSDGREMEMESKYLLCACYLHTLHCCEPNFIPSYAQFHCHKLLCILWLWEQGLCSVNDGSSSVSNVINHVNHEHSVGVSVCVEGLGGCLCFVNNQGGVACVVNNQGGVVNNQDGVICVVLLTIRMSCVVNNQDGVCVVLLTIRMVFVLCC